MMVPYVLTITHKFYLPNIKCTEQAVEKLKKCNFLPIFLSVLAVCFTNWIQFF